MKKIISSLIVVCVMLLVVGCSSKPSNEVMQGIMMTGFENQLNQYGNIKFAEVINWNFTKFDVTNDFFEKELYRVKVDLVGSVTVKNHLNNKTETIPIDSTIKYTFQKRGKEWYGKKGW
jgi:hypothetical protein